jgi:hypothetical protein
MHGDLNTQPPKGASSDKIASYDMDAKRPASAASELEKQNTKKRNIAVADNFTHMAECDILTNFYQT